MSSGDALENSSQLSACVADAEADNVHDSTTVVPGAGAAPPEAAEPAVVAAAPPPPKASKPRPPKKERTEGTAGPTGSKPAKAAKVRDGVEDLALGWLKRNNKPVTNQSMVDALQSKVSKPLVQKALDTLCEQGLIISKDIKKVKVYYLDQATLMQTEKKGEPSAAVEVAASPDSVVPLVCNPSDPPSEPSQQCTKQNKDELILSVLELEKRMRTATDEHSRLAHEPSVGDLVSAVDRTETNLLILQDRLAAVHRSLHGENGVPSLEEAPCARMDMRSAVDRYYSTRSLWRQRKMMASSVLDCLVGERVWREVTNEFGLTIDEDCGISLDTTAVFVPEKFRRK